MNAYIDDVTEEIVYHDFVDVSVAVAAPNGLVVPVIRNAHALTFAQVEQGIASLAAKVTNRSHTLTHTHMSTHD